MDKVMYVFAGVVLAITILLSSIFSVAMFEKPLAYGETPSNNTGKSAKDDKTIQDAFEYAEKEILPLEGVEGVAINDSVTPPTIIFFIESEQYRSIVPDEIMSFKTEIIISGKFRALDAPPLKVVLKVFPIGFRLSYPEITSS